VQKYVCGMAQSILLQCTPKTHFWGDQKIFSARRADSVPPTLTAGFRSWLRRFLNFEWVDADRWAELIDVNNQWRYRPTHAGNVIAVLQVLLSMSR